MHGTFGKRDTWKSNIIIFEIGSFCDFCSVMVSMFYDLLCDFDKKVCASLISFPKCSKKSVKCQNKMQDCKGSY